MIPAHELYHQHVRRQQSRQDTYNHLLQRIEKKIIHAANMDHYEVNFKVPHYLMGQPLYQLETCTLYLYMKLIRLGYHVEFIPPHTLSIHWRRFDTEVPTPPVQRPSPPSLPAPPPPSLVAPPPPSLPAPPPSAPPLPPVQPLLPLSLLPRGPGSNMFPTRNLAERKKVQFQGQETSYLDQLMAEREKALSTWKVQPF